MYLRLSKRSLSRSIQTQLHAVTAASVIAIASATGALAQSAAEPAVAEGELPLLTVETTPKKTIKKKPTSEPQAAVTKETSPAADPEAPVVFSANRTPTDARQGRLQRFGHHREGHRRPVEDIPAGLSAAGAGRQHIDGRRIRADDDIQVARLKPELRQGFGRRHGHERPVQHTDGACVRAPACR